MHQELDHTALGIALQEGAIASLDEPLAAFFPEHQPTNSAGITLTHAVTMTTGFDCIVSPGEPTLTEMQSAPNWLEFALDVPIADAPGTAWRYCGTATHLLSGVITRATGEPMDAFLERRLFQPIGAGAAAWPRDPQGNTVGWGDARLTPEAMIRVGQTWLGQGKFGGERIVGEDYMALATANRVGDLGPPGGYGYGFWIGGNDSYYADGRGGQNVIVIPRLELVVAVTAGQSPAQHQAFQARLGEELALGLSDTPLPENPAALAQLETYASSLPLPPAPEPIPTPPAVAAQISGKTYTLASNLLGWTTLRLTFDADHATLDTGTASASASAAIGLDSVPRITRGVRFADPERYQDIDVAMAGRWLDDARFEVEFATIDTIDAGTLRFELHEGSVKIVLYEKTYLLTEIMIEGTE